MLLVHYVTDYAVSTAQPAPPWLLIVFGCLLAGMGWLFVRSDVPGISGFLRFKLGGIVGMWVGVAIMIIGIARAL